MTLYASKTGQRNPPNPILVEFRDDLRHLPDWTASDLATEWDNGGHLARSLWGYSDDVLHHIDHARRVLTRLTRFQEHTP